MFINNSLTFHSTISLADADRIFSDSSDSLGEKENSKAVVVVVTYNEKGAVISQGMNASMPTCVQLAQLARLT